MYKRDVLVIGHHQVRPRKVYANVITVANQEEAINRLMQQPIDFVAADSETSIDKLQPILRKWYPQTTLLIADKHHFEDDIKQKKLQTQENTSFDVLDNSGELKLAAYLKHNA